MHAIAFICSSSGGPVPNVLVTVFSALSPTGGRVVLDVGMTNNDGYVLFNYMPNNETVYVTFEGANYVNYAQEFVLGDVNKNYSIQLVASFNKPSRDSIINVKANLCNLYDADNNPIFEPMINWLILNNHNKAMDWISRAKAAKSTHYNVAIACNYRNNPVPGMDFTNNLATFSNIIDWIKARGLIPIVKLAGDGQGFDPNGLTYGWQWLMNNIERIANGLSKHIESVLWSTGFDGCFPNWSPDQTTQMLRKMRAVLGAKAQIDTEFAGPNTWSYIHMGNGSADWAKDKLGILDHFSLEAQTFPVDVTAGAQEIATRLLGPNCLIGPQQPYYLANLDKTIAIDVYETVAYWFYNVKIATPQDAIDVANSMSKYGFKAFGNGIPT